jgi:phosphopantothenoylcysteine decarboxylase/phosphopantothenate--cysteine ligase
MVVWLCHNLQQLTMKIVLGITGSIAAYKAAELISRLKDRGHEVYPVLTTDAEKFITSLTLETLAQKRTQAPIPHVNLATQADVILIAPATANTIGKIAHGIADNLLTETVMAARCPVLIAPAMNTAMWDNPIVQSNMETLRRLGYQFIDAEEGELACGLVGKGRLAKLDVILASLDAVTDGASPPLLS